MLSSSVSSSKYRNIENFDKTGYLDQVINISQQLFNGSQITAAAYLANLMDLHHNENWDAKFNELNQVLLPLTKNHYKLSLFQKTFPRGMQKIFALLYIQECKENAFMNTKLENEKILNFDGLKTFIYNLAPEEDKNYIVAHLKNDYFSNIKLSCNNMVQFGVKNYKSTMKLPEKNEIIAPNEIIGTLNNSVQIMKYLVDVPLISSTTTIIKAYSKQIIAPELIKRISEIKESDNNSPKIFNSTYAKNQQSRIPKPSLVNISRKSIDTALAKLTSIKKNENMNDIIKLYFLFKITQGGIDDFNYDKYQGLREIGTKLHATNYKNYTNEINKCAYALKMNIKNEEFIVFINSITKGEKYIFEKYYNEIA